ncbi:MAG: hypothetical protein KKH93_04635 [Candidatus Omnitrophica bacterium]|nr:hypothetical protein [Candidatus Omnitrophota bacterium]MBU2043936.1 hypothetical protein [Candidatus Omnitrophota bacterium]MBU2250941.1 hypothetical protein [Candidatus Omnitrophota bacterium]MBU2265837.1 hypothetical protein [Candidatus Omnitrophota bacterium]MBU2474141.1 hypothetical protein [Candidatus Omnitrophota bacterium]
MIGFLFRILFFYLIFSLIFRVIIFFIRLFASQARYNRQQQNQPKQKQQPPEYKDVIDAEFREEE